MSITPTAVDRDLPRSVLTATTPGGRHVRPAAQPSHQEEQ